MGKITEVIKKYTSNNPLDVARETYGLGKDLTEMAKSKWRGKVLKDKLQSVQKEKENKKNEPQVFKRTQADKALWQNR